MAPKSQSSKAKNPKAKRYKLQTKSTLKNVVLDCTRLLDRLIHIGANWRRSEPNRHRNQHRGHQSDANRNEHLCATDLYMKCNQRMLQYHRFQRVGNAKCRETP